MAPTLLLLLHTFFAAAALTSLTLASVISVTSASPSRPHRPDLTLGSSSSSSSSSSSAEKSAHVNVEVTQPVAGCPSGQYFSDVELACHPCSSCPVNQIIRRPCSARADTWCGPFLEFDKFHQTPAEETGRVAVGLQQNGHVGGGGGGGGRGKHHPGHGHHHGHHHDRSEEAATEPDLTSSVTLDRARSQWRTLSFALIVVLCVVCGLVVFVGLYVFTVCRRSRAEKQYFREPGPVTGAGAGRRLGENDADGKSLMKLERAAALPYRTVADIADRPPSPSPARVIVTQ